MRAETSLRTAAAAAFACMIFTTGPAHAASSDVGASVVAQSDRSEDDRKQDARRQPAKLLDFAGIKPGMTVFDLMAGSGYTTELLARAVGKNGKVYAQNSTTAPERVLNNMGERLKKPVMANVTLVSAPSDEAFPDGVHPDVVTFVLNYHDTTFLPIDRAKMNKAVFDGLKPGGTYIVVDHSAKAGDGATVGKSLHRIEESTVIAEVEAAGFKKEAEADFLRQPGDTRDLSIFKLEDKPSDEFVLKFRKP